MPIDPGRGEACHSSSARRRDGCRSRENLSPVLLRSRSLPEERRPLKRVLLSWQDPCKAPTVVG
ncbi:MAG: hypothetical protein ABW185_20950 [Sedimenticola sp.]